jgi:hypothetical protein
MRWCRRWITTARPIAAAAAVAELEEEVLEVCDKAAKCSDMIPPRLHEAAVHLQR